MVDDSFESTNSDGTGTRCVLLAAGGEQPPERLMMLLDQPSTRTVTVAHPLLAAAELASLERARSAPGEPSTSGERTVLVVVNRESWRDLSPLFRTVRIHMPGVAIWVCTERVAIEVYAGTEPANEHQKEPLDFNHEGKPPLTEMSENPIEETKDASQVTEDELRFLLDLYDSEAEEEDSEKDSPGGSAPEDLK